MDRKIIAAAAGILILALAPSRGSTQESSKSFAISRVRVFDGERVIPDGTVVVENGKIAAVGAKVVVPPGAETIDGGGKTLLPGLIDTHVHAFAVQQLKQSLVFGVTTVIDMFMDVKFLREMKQQQNAGQADDRAYIVSAGILATAPGGHGTEYGIAVPTLSKPEEADAFVDARVAEGSDFIKIILDDGSTYGMKLPTLDTATVAALIRAAHRHGRLAIVHAATLDNCRDAINAGADGLAHLYLDSATDPGFAPLVANHKAFVIPTLSPSEGLGGDCDTTDVLKDARLAPYLTADDVRGLRSSFPVSAAKDLTSIQFATMRQLRAKGVTLLAGTDAPNPGTTFGASLHHELLLLVKAGLTPLEALRAATSAPADRFSIPDRGRIRRGFAADLVLVEGDPTVDIKATRRVIGVWHNGVKVERDTYAEAIYREKEKAQQRKTGSPPANSESGWISDFESDTVVADFGAGWSVSTDSYMGGRSEAEYHLVKGGAQESTQSLSITGTIANGSAYPWAGMMFFPGSYPMQAANLSRWKGVEFSAKGDGKTYAVMIFAQSLGFRPAIRVFQAGPDWKECFFPFDAFGIQGYDITGIFIGASQEKGGFALQIDNVRLK